MNNGTLTFRITADAPLSDEVVRMLAACGATVTDLRVNALDKRVNSLFNAIGFRPDLSGTAYLKEAVKYCLSGGKRPNMKEIYRAVGDSLGVAPENVERSVRHAIHALWDNVNYDYINRLFGVGLFSKRVRPTNAEMVALLVEKLRYE